MKTEIYNQKTIENMLREIEKIEVQHLNNAARELSYYLNEAQAITKNYHYTLVLGNDQTAIINMDNEELKRIAAIIYVCYQNLGLNYEITYDGDSFNVDIIQEEETPF